MSHGFKNVDMNLPLVSLIIPTYGRPVNIIRAINSCLSQSYQNIEIIVVDDNGKGSPQQIETEKILRDNGLLDRISYLTHPCNKNGAAARNTGFRLSKGSFINFVDDDDELSTTKIADQVSFLTSHTDYDACFCDTLHKMYKREFLIKNEINPETSIMKDMLTGKLFFNTTTVLFRRNVIQELNGFDESFNRHQDYELYMRFCRSFKFGKSNGLVIKYQSENIVSRNPLKSIDFLEFFLDKFKNDIDSLPDSNEIYRYQYECLGDFLLSVKHTKEGIKYIKKAFKFGVPSFKRLSLYMYHLIK